MNDSSIFAELGDGATLVTANKRLAREMRQQFNDYQRTRGEQVWDTADILPFEAWIFRLWHDIRNDHQGEGGTTPRIGMAGETAPNAQQNSVVAQPNRIILNALQSKAVWTHIIATDISKNHHDSEPLWNIAATVRAVMEAWRICCQWDIAIAECAKSFLPDHRSFCRWADSFIHQSGKNNWIDAHQLIDVVMDEWASTSTLLESVAETGLIWMGFDGLNAQQKRLIEMLAQNDVHVDIHQFANKGSADCQFQQYESESDQWLAAAYWIKEKIERDRKQRLAVVVPNLSQSRGAIDHALSQVLSPHHLFDTGSNRAKPFHISLGVKLIDAPVVNAALLLLSLSSTAGPSGSTISNATISKVLLSSFIGGADSECHARNKFEFWCRQYLPYELAFSDFLVFLKQEPKQGQSVPPVFAKIINANSGLMKASQQARSFSDWSEFFLRWLENLGWPGERTLNSEQYQTVEAFKREVAILRSLDMIGKEVTSESVTVATALAVLKQRLNEQPFEPESAHVHVDVLGIMETSSIEFDAIWFGGLTEKDWPPALQASPFIPHELQQQAGYHRASISLNAEHARKQQNRLLGQCSEIVFSRYCFDRDVALLPSAFFEETQKTEEIERTEKKDEHKSLIACLQIQKPELETFIGTQGVGKFDSATRGGTAVIRDQAACPFRAYAKHRLGARDSDMRKPGLDAAERGKLVHSVLESVWQTLQSSQKLATVSDDELQHIVDDNIRKCSKRFFHASGSGSGFFRVQAQWLRALLLEWLAMEKNSGQRFRVIEIEKPQQLVLGKLTLNFKIDRMDELDDKTQVLIDYKTGTASSRAKWSGDRPKEPQLPLYALAQHADLNKHKNNVALSGLQFGQVCTGGCAYVGINQNNIIKTAEQVTGKSQKSEATGLDEVLESWQALIEYWNEQLTKLADQHYAGHAEVAPLDKTTCHYCDLPGLCRIGNRETDAKGREDGAKND